MSGVRIVAHRGLPGPARPENTVAAVRAAFDEAGADGVEVDLRLTADGVLAVCHDPDLERLTGQRVVVADTTWSALAGTAADYDVTLAHVAEILEVAHGRAIVLELKQPPPGGARVEHTASVLAARLERCVRDGLDVDLTVSSFSPSMVAAVRRHSSVTLPVRTALLGRPMARPVGLLRQALNAGHDEVHPHVLALLAEPIAVDLAHRTGVRVVPWTANGRSELRSLAMAGVDGVITDTPLHARRYVQGLPVVAGGSSE